MTTSTQASSPTWIIPPATLDFLKRAPDSAAIAMLVRHSVRPPMLPGDAGYALPITEDGARIARDLGHVIGPRLRTLHASPLARCMQTASAIAVGAMANTESKEDRLLGGHGVFVLDNHVAWSNWEQLGHAGVMERLVTQDAALPGMAAPGQAARFLVHHMLTLADGAPGIHVFVTHDSLVTATAGRLLGQKLGTDAWPWFLEAAFFWRDMDGVHSAYREHTGVVPAPLCELTADDVVEFARRELANTVGLGHCGRYFLAGGAFKTLLTGKPPRDLDLWAPSPGDREALLTTLRARGARPLPPRPFGEAFVLADRVVEVPHRTDPTTLEERLARFDIALSAVGVEHLGNDQWRAVVHPEAEASVKDRRVTFLKPLVNWRHALSSLARARRYAAELRYALPTSEEAEVWRAFNAQPREMQDGMIDRYRLVAAAGSEIEQEASCRRQ